eukprot:TRINITY_DN4363_c0_g4_i1.p1 TRINITY_DN4363_c0_g4~~TRINITY_DN4363_c0_g4_i1.p1  ORF type:complete len:217 (-),score=-24.41 TRINITY_DN4363_c0_g4_i1:1-618(-)
MHQKHLIKTQVFSIMSIFSLEFQIQLAHGLQGICLAIAICLLTVHLDALISNLKNVCACYKELSNLRQQRGMTVHIINIFQYTHYKLIQKVQMNIFDFFKFSFFSLLYQIWQGGKLYVSSRSKITGFFNVCTQKNYKLLYQLQTQKFGIFLTFFSLYSKFCKFENHTFQIGCRKLHNNFMCVFEPDLTCMHILSNDSFASTVTIP